MAGIYIHIPFCTSKCHYCNFLSTVSLKYRKEVVDAIALEARQQKDFFKNKTIHTLYFGGGTPTVLSKEELEFILIALRNNFDLSQLKEITIEANPDDINPKILKDLSDLGFNRLSMGTQAFDDKLLQQLNRRHSAKQSINAVKLAQQNGFENLSIDLIYGIPGLSNQQWKEELQGVLEMQVPHISAYHLTVEPGTALEVLIRKKKYPQPQEQAGMEQFEILMDTLEQAAYEHYEISNFSIPGQRSQHNSSYWSGSSYLGLGPSAHSFNGSIRSWNTLNLRKYFEGIQNHNPKREKEELSFEDRYNEFVMLSLRTMEGLSKERLLKEFEFYAKDFKILTKDMLAKGWMQETEQAYILTRRGKMLADGIAAEFFQ
jgi:oxygen-independent coproporphyrinogen-3 oxidase